MIPSAIFAYKMYYDLPIIDISISNTPFDGYPTLVASYTTCIRTHTEYFGYTWKYIFITQPPRLKTSAGEGTRRVIDRQRSAAKPIGALGAGPSGEDASAAGGFVKKRTKRMAAVGQTWCLVLSS